MNTADIVKALRAGGVAETEIMTVVTSLLYAKQAVTGNLSPELATRFGSLVINKLRTLQ